MLIAESFEKSNGCPTPAPPSNPVPVGQEATKVNCRRRLAGQTPDRQVSTIENAASNTRLSKLLAGSDGASAPAISGAQRNELLPSTREQPG